MHCYSIALAASYSWMYNKSSRLQTRMKTSTITGNKLHCSSTYCYILDFKEGLSTSYWLYSLESIYGTGRGLIKSCSSIGLVARSPSSNVTLPVNLSRWKSTPHFSPRIRWRITPSTRYCTMLCIYFVRICRKSDKREG